MWHVALVLSDAPAILKGSLSWPRRSPHHVRQRLSNLCARRHRLREHCCGVGDAEATPGRAANRGQGEHPHLGELVGDVQQADINRPSGTGIRLTSLAPMENRWLPHHLGCGPRGEAGANNSWRS